MAASGPCCFDIARPGRPPLTTTALLWLCGVCVWSGYLFYYPPDALGWEVTMLFLLAIMEACRLFLGGCRRCCL